MEEELPIKTKTSAPSSAEESTSASLGKGESTPKRDENAPLRFPYRLFPVIIQKIIEETHQDLLFPLNYIAAVLFFAIGAALGNRVRLMVKQGWTEKAIMFMCLVGRPGASKTHPVSFALAPLKELDKKAYKQYESALFDYNALPPEQRGEKPTAHQSIVQDITMEALIDVHRYNPKGICVHLDELKGWFSSFDRYRKGGGDEQQWLTCWNGERIVKNRVTSGLKCIDDSFISVVGGMQPGVLKKTFRGERIENGMLSRVLFVNNDDEDEVVLWGEDDLISDAADVWRSFLFSVLASFGFFDGDGVTRELRFSAEAWNHIKDWRNCITKANFDNGADSSAEIFAKIQTYAMRFCLIIHIMREVAGEIEKTDEIGFEDAVKAQLIADYFYGSALDTYALITTSNENGQNFFQLLNRLNNKFTTAQALEVGAHMGLSRRTVFRLLDVPVDDPFLRKLKHGTYEKIE